MRALVLVACLLHIAYGQLGKTAKKDCIQEGHTCRDTNLDVCEGDWSQDLVCSGYWGIQCCIQLEKPSTPPTPSVTRQTVTSPESSSTATSSPGSTQKPQYGNCGARTMSYITHGWEATPYSWPWMASLRSSGGLTHTCGAVLINNQWLLTAAHCIDSIYDTVTSFRVMLGAHFQYRDNPHSITATLSRMIKHPKYEKSGPGFPYDVALLKMTRPVTFNRYIQPVCLPAAGEVFSPTDNCYIAGWGETKGTSDRNDEVLNEVQLNVVPNGECSTMWAKYPKNGPKIWDFHICIGDGRKGSCNGDSGGPLMCERGASKWVLAGTSSWAMAGCRGAGFPAVYMRTASVLDWIQHETSLTGV